MIAHSPHFASSAAESPVGDVFFDANPLLDKHLTGIGRYAARLALALSKRRRVRFFAGRRELITPRGLDWSPDQDLGRWARRATSGRRPDLAAIPDDALGVYCCLRPSERLFRYEASVLHDFTPQVVPATHTEATRGLFNGFCAVTMKSSDVALAVSHSTKADAAWLADFNPDRVVVAHSGPSLCVERCLHAARVPRRAEVGLVVSTLEPRKNPEFLLDWFTKSDALPDHAELWWVGRLGWLTSRKRLRKFECAHATRRVRFLGVVDDETLCRLYQAAGWAAYPSLYEGFGFPVVDALRHGAPVLTAYHSSLREFDRPGVSFFDPCDPSTLDEAWAQLQSTPLPDRAALDRDFSWDRVASTLLRAFAEPAPMLAQVRDDSAA